MWQCRVLWQVAAIRSHSHDDPENEGLNGYYGRETPSTTTRTGLSIR